jgi:hypothetical protein
MLESSASSATIELLDIRYWRPQCANRIARVDFTRSSSLAGGIDTRSENILNPSSFVGATSHVTWQTKRQTISRVSLIGLLLTGQEYRKRHGRSHASWCLWGHCHRSSSRCFHSFSPGKEWKRGGILCEEGRAVLKLDLKWYPARREEFITSALPSFRGH